MAVNRGRALRHLGRMSLVFAYLVEAMTHPLPSTQAAQTCFGKAATIADHHGDIAGTAGDDVMIGDDGDNDFESNGGTDYICGLGGDDMVGYQFNAVIYAEGGPGNDWLLGGNSGNELHGGGGADQLDGHNGLDLLYGDGGNDLLFGAAVRTSSMAATARTTSTAATAMTTSSVRVTPTGSSVVTVLTPLVVAAAPTSATPGPSPMASSTVEAAPTDDTARHREAAPARGARQSKGAEMDG